MELTRQQRRMYEREVGSAKARLERANVALRASLPELHRIIDHEHASRAHPTVSCTKSCASAGQGCCRQAVMTEISEAEEILVRYPEAVVRAIPTIIQQNYILATHIAPEVWNQMYATMHLRDEGDNDVAKLYFKLNMPCAFFVDGLCSVYGARPIPCRTHFVSSPPEQCTVEGGTMDVLDLGTRHRAAEALTKLVMSTRDQPAIGFLPQLMLQVLGKGGVRQFSP